MTHAPYEPPTDLQEVATRNHIAHEIVTGLVPGQIWQYIETALSDVPALIAEIEDLRATIDTSRLNRANLAAAALATIAAHRDGEPDSLSYLRDELTAQGFHLRQLP